MVSGYYFPESSVWHTTRPGGYGTDSATRCRQHSSVDTSSAVCQTVFGQGNNSSLGATVEKRGPSKINNKTAGTTVSEKS